MLCMIKGYTDSGLSVPCCRGEADVFRDKNRRNCIGEFISTAIISDPGTEGWKRGRDKHRKREHRYQRWREPLIHFKAD